MITRNIVAKAVGFLVFIIMVLLIEVTCVLGGWFALDLRARQSISERLGIEANWTSLEEYIPTNLQPGMTRKEILESADIIGPYVINPFFLGTEYCEAFYFTVGPFGTSRGGRWHICYDKNDIAIKVEQFRRQ